MRLSALAYLRVILIATAIATSPFTSQAQQQPLVPLSEFTGNWCTNGKWVPSFCNQDDLNLRETRYWAGWCLAAVDAGYFSQPEDCFPDILPIMLTAALSGAYNGETLSDDPDDDNDEPDPDTPGGGDNDE
jgi:hypothetical protein